jgi:structural maintenance of chromosome 2
LNRLFSQLFNIVVDNEVTGKLLLDKGKLQRRVTFIPLNKINGHVVDANTFEKAKRVANKIARGGGVWRAYDLVKFDQELDPAMRWLLGTQLVCENMDIAKAVAYDKQIMRRCVTLEGDVFDPSGTLSGGEHQYEAFCFQVAIKRRISIKESIPFGPPVYTHFCLNI